MDWSIRPDDGVLMIGQVGWTPEFFKRPVTTPAADAPAADGKSTVEQKSFKSVSAVPEMAGLPGHYWMGAYYSPWQFQQFGSDETAGNSYGFYWHADQMVFQESPGSVQGLTLWTASVLSPQQNIAKLPFQLNAGTVYVGLVPGRDADATMLGFVYGKFSRDFARSVDVDGAGFPEYEIVLEAGHRFQINQFLYAQPNLQWVINPGGTGNIPNALVLGSQVGVIF
jgi:porin